MGRPRIKRENVARVCRICEQMKEAVEYYPTSKDYFVCKSCHSKRVMNNQTKKKEYYNEYRKQYVKNHPEKQEQWIENYSERFRESHSGRSVAQLYYWQHIKPNPERVKLMNERKKEYDKKNKEKKKAYAKEYYQRNKRKIIDAANARNKLKREQLKSDRGTKGKAEKI